MVVISSAGAIRGKFMEGKKTIFSIRKKMLCSYLVIVAFILGVGLLGIYNIYRVYKNGNEMYVNNLKSIENLRDINQNVREIDQCIMSMMGPLADDYYTVNKEKIISLEAANQELMKEYSKIYVSDLEKRRYNQCRLSVITFNKQMDSLVTMLDEAQGMEDEQEKTRIQNNVVTTYEQELMPVKACTYELIEAVMDLADANARQKNVDNYRTYNNLLWIIGAVMVLSIFIAVLITIKMSGDFTERLGQIQKLALRISEYDLSDDIKETGNDEFGETIAALNESQFMLRNLLEKITTESATIDDIGNEISEAVRKSGQRIEAVNVDLYNVEEMLETLEDKIQKTMTSDNSVEDMVKTLQQIEVQCQDSKDWTQEMQTSLTGIATYLEQIGITAEYQNEIANSHRVQVERFRVSQES
jgi:methyl-accepting chemotaxis protein